MNSSKSKMDRRILVIDGHPVYIHKLAGFLGGLTFQNVALAVSGQDGINKAELIKPDLVILSGMLWDMPSEEVCRKIKAMNKNVKIIVQTGLFTEEEGLKKIKDGGADAILARKEKDLTPLQELIEEFMR